MKKQMIAALAAILLVSCGSETTGTSSAPSQTASIEETVILDQGGRELLRLIEVGASCFNRYCTGCDFSQRSVLHNVHRRIRSGYSIPTFCLCC